MTYSLPEAPIWQTPKTQDKTTVELKLSLITPMFGGGYEARMLDEDNLIRSAEVRGHLRFWWRATAGGACKTPKALFEAEAELWGSDQKAGHVQIVVCDVTHGSPEASAVFQMRNDKYTSIPDFRGKPGYALFPFQGKARGQTIEEAPAKLIQKASFTLRITAQSTRIDEVTSAVAAWVKYGGIGARTRRGCGSLKLDGVMPDICMYENENNLIPLLKGAKFIVSGDIKTDAIDAWKNAVGIYKDFRQKEKHARNPGSQPNRPGRSLWPEPDSIRRLAKTHSFRHKPMHKVEVGFPRADLGLPIVFQFKDSDSGDPTEATLNGPKELMTRFSSPVITKAIPMNNGYAAMILILNSPHAWDVGDLKLKLERGEVKIPRAKIELTPNERALINPLRRGKPVREALLDYVSDIWKKPVEVIR